MQPPESKFLTRDDIVLLWVAVSLARTRNDDMLGAWQAKENAWAVRMADLHDKYTFHRPAGYGTVVR